MVNCDAGAIVSASLNPGVGTVPSSHLQWADQSKLPRGRPRGRGPPGRQARMTHPAEQ